MVGSYLVTGMISTFVNAHPNKRVIGYSYLEQLRDILPGVMLSLISALIAWPVGLLVLPDLATVLLQALMMATAYLGLSKVFHVEALEYLIATVREVMSSKKELGLRRNKSST